MNVQTSVTHRQCADSECVCVYVPPPRCPQEAVQCVQEMNSPQLLFVFVRNGLESTLERSTIAREHMGLLLHQLVKAHVLPTQQFYRGSGPAHIDDITAHSGSAAEQTCLHRLQEILEVAEDMAIDIPHIWTYLAEQIVPLVHEGGIPMGPLFR